MSFRFLHTADWHIGKTFGAFDAERGPQLRAARERVIEAVAETARAQNAPYVLVGGDSLDSQGLPDATLRRLLSLLAGANDIAWHLLPGNHDADQSRGVWDRIVKFGIPKNVTLHRKAEPYQLAHGVVLLPAPLTARLTDSDPTLWFDAAERPEQSIVVGLAHGSTQNFGGESSASVPIAPDRATRAGLDYLALGDWHGTRQIADRVWYSGTPEPTGFVDNDAGNVLVVSIEAPGAKPQVQKIPTAQFSWHRIANEIDASSPVSAIVAQLQAIDGLKSRQLVRLYLSGQATLTDHTILRRELEALAPSFFDLDVRWDNLNLLPVGDTQDLFEAPELAAIAARLTDDGSNLADSDTKRRALQLLGDFAHKVKEQAQ